MRKLIAIQQVSLDGVMQAPGGPEEDPTEDFPYGGWTASYWDDKTGESMNELMSRPFDLLLGRRTYDIFASYWPHAGKGPISDGFNRAVKYVASRGRPALPWVNSQALQGDAIEAVRQIKLGSGPEIQIYGSSNFMQALNAADLIDEYLLRMCPVVLGRGKRLFEAGAPARALKLVDTQHSSTGVITSRFVPDGPLRVGTVADPAAR